MLRQPFYLTGFALAVAAHAAPSASAQEKTAEKPFRLGSTIGAPDWLKVSGSIRPRYETLGNTFYAGRTGGDELFSVQTLLKVEAGTGDFVIGGELLDARLLSGNAGGGAAAEVDALEPAQFYLAWRPKNFLMQGANLDLTLGRFTMDIGSRRLAARANYRNILTQFDGVRAIWTSADKLKATAFYSTVAPRIPSDQPSALDNEVAFNPVEDNVRFSGLDIETPLPGGIVGELYLLDLDEKDAAGLPTRNRDLSTLGGRLRVAPKTGAFDFEIEYAGQTGTVRATTSPADVTNLDHDASMLHLEGGVTFDGPWTPRIAVQLDHATGDRSPADLSSERFDSLFGDRSFEYGPTSIYGAVARTNMLSPALRLEFKPDGDSDAYIAIRRITLDQSRDSFANSGVRDASGASGDDAATQLDFRYRRWLVPDSVRWSFGAARLFRGDFLKQAPNATGQGDALFGFTDVTWTF
ncbi:MAG: alginate export family protein [Hyphomonadaceae bacterium]